MKKNANFTVTLFFLLVLLLSSCSRNFESRVNRLVYLEESEALSGEISDERLREIKGSVREYQDILDAKVEAGKEIGNFYRLLAEEFMDHEMFGLALDNYKEALRIYSSSFTLHYHAGVCAARQSLAEVEPEDRLALLYEAETFYKKALQLNRNYSEVRYALAVLYFYEMDSPYKAEPLLETLIEQNPGDTDSLFLMGAVQTSLGNTDEAVYYYEMIADISEDPDVVDQAMENRNALMGGF